MVVELGRFQDIAAIFCQKSRDISNNANFIRAGKGEYVFHNVRFTISKFDSISQIIMQKPLTILQILPALEQGGVERGTVEIDNALVEAGHTSIVVSAGGRMVSQLKGKHLQLPLDSKNPAKILFNAHLLKFVIKENNVDIVHARSRAPAWSAYLAAKSTKTHFLTTFHGTYGIGNALKKKYNSVMTKGEKIIAVSDFIKNHIIENYGISAEKIITIHRGADLEKFCPDITPEKLGLPQGKKVVMLPGRVSRWKGHHVFIEAMKSVDALGVIVGDVESAEYMRELEQIMSDNIITLPGTPNLPPVMANADIIVSASTKPEAFGRIAIEAQAMGKPVVATNIGGALETVVEGKTGYLVKPNDAADMRAAIQKILEDGRAWSETCRKNAENFSRQKMCEKTLAVYQQLVG